MKTIKLTEADAKKIADYFHKELEDENKNYSEAMTLIEEHKEDRDKEEIDFLRYCANKGHAHNVQVMARNIDLLENGSEEFRKDSTKATEAEPKA